MIGMKTIEIEANFIGDFKVGDNIACNCEMLCELVGANSTGKLNKVIVLQAVSILEACMSEIIFRAQEFNREGVPKISEEDQKQIKDKKYDKLATITDAFRKYKLLDGLGKGVYENIHLLRKYRNKVHIQNDVKDLAERNECNIFDDDFTKFALEKVIEIVQFLSGNLSRPDHIKGHVRPFTFPII